MISALKYSPPVAKLARYWYDWRTRHVEQWIFVATTGRSGTLTLVDLFAQVPDCVALHEPYPAMHGEILHSASYGDKARVTRFYNTRKAVNIRRSAVGARSYLEANHLFIKSFAEQAAGDFRQRTRVIHLVRNPDGVAHSIYQLEDEPGTVAGNRWWLDYRAPSNLISLADALERHPEYSHPYFKGLWYWFEVEARIQHWREQWPGIPMVTFHTEDFSSLQAVGDLFSSLDINLEDTRLESMINVRRHERAHQKRRAPLALSERQAMQQAFRCLLEERGFHLPGSYQRYAHPN
ncbi:sulfotransferase domain-containing protein [Parahaliea aestuarii]|uniref:Sulfotransferase domain-containing protein n=1 Tax=Parahaliea aestuarii TaxID=1852021 RepID=A0A5C8ZPI9_9GAMM|nr:sulfotransferase domain-containing protein [Parahaliea aestuarii]TXS89630.1 sulfotransferase domain-containing protein [Parahaliea aestuarii]